MSIIRIRYLNWLKTEHKEDIISFYSDENNVEAKEEVENLYILTKNDKTVFLSKDYMYVPLKIVGNIDALNVEIENLSEEANIPNRSISFKLEDNNDKLSELKYLSYLDTSYDDNIRQVLEKLDIKFLYISVENNFFNIEREYEKIYYWVETILIQLSEKLNISLNIYQKKVHEGSTESTPFKDSINIENEIYFDELSLKYLSRAQEFYLTAPHIAFLEYYHILERYMKDVKYSRYLESYQNVYSILSGTEDELKKKEDVIKEVGNINKSLSEMELFRELVNEDIYENLFDSLRSEKELLKEAPPYIEEYQKNQIKLEGKSKFKKSIIERLYFTRNSIVHSKSFDGEDTFDVYNDRHIRYLKVDLFILRYIVIEFLKRKDTNSTLNHFIKMQHLT